MPFIFGKHQCILTCYRNTQSGLGFYYLLHSEQYHSLFCQVFGEHLKAKQHVRGGHRVQGVGRQEHALEAVLPHLRGVKPNFQSYLRNFCLGILKILKILPLQVSDSLV